MLKETSQLAVGLYSVTPSTTEIEKSRHLDRMHSTQKLTLDSAQTLLAERPKPTLLVLLVAKERNA